MPTITLCYASELVLCLWPSQLSQLPAPIPQQVVTARLAGGGACTGIFSIILCLPRLPPPELGVLDDAPPSPFARSWLATPATMASRVAGSSRTAETVGGRVLAAASFPFGVGVRGSASPDVPAEASLRVAIAV